MKKKKLDLKRQVVLQLDPRRLRQVQGGVAEADCPPTWDLKTVVSRLTHCD
jgi:hypothetical protein